MVNVLSELRQPALAQGRPVGSAENGIQRQQPVRDGQYLARLRELGIPYPTPAQRSS